MKIALKGNVLCIKAMDETQQSIILSWNLMKWDKQTKTFTGMASLELLEKLSGITALPTGSTNTKTGEPNPNIAEYYRTLREIRAAVDRERLAKDPEPIFDPPVKVPLYAHQIRGMNMALLTFGWAEL